MPELPEVETILRGARPYCEGQTVQKVIVRNAALRWKVASDVPYQLEGKVIQSVTRRAKYLLFHFKHGQAILHLGMSGRLRAMPPGLPPEKHDHIDIELDNAIVLRYTDPRRFGAFLWQALSTPHPLLAHLGPEPLGRQFSGDHLWLSAKGRKVAIKNFLMDSKIVVGIGNIYAAEALFIAKISPLVAAGSLSKDRLVCLAYAVKLVLKQAIKEGGTTLKDYVNIGGTSGHFAQTLKVYGRAGAPCVECGEKLLSIKIGQRSTVFCATCQQ